MNLFVVYAKAVGADKVQPFDRFGNVPKDARAKMVKNPKVAKVYAVKAHDGTKFLYGGRFV